MILYLETSNLVKLYVEEAGTAEVKAGVAECEAVATSIVSYVEARAAFARKAGEKALAPACYQAVKADLERDWDSFFALNLTGELIRLAADLAEKHGLRGYDAIHLASAVNLKRAMGAAADLVFSSADDRLRTAALTEGLR